MSNKKPLYLFIGKSASGKTTVAEIMEEEGYKQVQSYTTRPKRYENEKGHVFITDEECFDIKNIMASTLYNGYWYCATLEQIQDADIYVIDPTGAKELLHNYDKLNRKVYIVYFKSSVGNRITHMLKRGDSYGQIIERITHDGQEGWFKSIKEYIKLNSLPCDGVFKVDANAPIEIVLEDILDIFEYCEEQ